MMKYAVFFIVLFSYSWADILQEIRLDLTELKKQHVTIDADIQHVKYSNMIADPCNCLHAFLRELNGMLDHVKDQGSSKRIADITKKLKANIEALYRLDQPKTTRCNYQRRSKRNISSHKVLVDNIKYIQTWNEKCL